MSTTIIASIRSLKRNWFYTLSIIAGFSLSVAIATLLFTYVMYETNTDAEHPAGDRLYRLLMEHPITHKTDITTFRYLQDKLSQFPEVEVAAHIHYSGPLTISVGDELFRENAALFTDEHFFEVFGFPLISGKRNNLLKAPLQVVISETAALKYYNTTAAVGREIKIDTVVYEIGGVVNEKFNSHLQFNLLISTSSLPPYSFPFDYPGSTYVRLKKNATASSFESKLAANQNDLLPMPAEKPSAKPFTAQPIKEVYYDRPSNPFYKSIIQTREAWVIKLLKWIGAGLIIISLVNYGIFCQANAAGQIKDMLIKRIHGATFRALLGRLLIESLTIMIISSVVGFILVLLVIPVSATLLNSTMEADFVWNPAVIFWLCVTITVTAFVFAFLNAMAIWNSTGSKTIRSTVATKYNTRVLGGVLLIQLTVCITLIMFCATVVYQLHYIQNTPLGFQKENIVELKLNSAQVRISPQAVRDEFVKLAQVQSASVALGTPLTSRWVSNIKIDNADVQVSSFSGDAFFVTTMQFELTKGRAFDPSMLSDTSAVLVNESAGKLLELDADLQPRDSDVRSRFHVIGVVKDFHYSTLKEAIGPAVIGFHRFNHFPDGEDLQLVVKFAGDGNTFLADARELLKKFAPSHPLEYSFVDEKHKALYRDEFQQGSLLITGTFTVLFVSVFGLAGIAFFFAQRKTKEVAIRKVLGAHTASIVSASILKLLTAVLLSACIGLPLAMYFSKAWLQNFVYRIEPSWQLGAISVVMLFLFCLLVVTFQIVRTSNSNPAVVLRAE